MIFTLSKNWIAVELVTSISIFLIKQLLPTFVRRNKHVVKLLNSVLGSILYSWNKQVRKYKLYGNNCFINFN